MTSMVSLRIADITTETKYDKVEQQDISVSDTAYEVLDDNGDVISSIVVTVAYPTRKGSWLTAIDWEAIEDKIKKRYDDN